MTQSPSNSLRRALVFAVAVLIVRVMAEVVAGYRNYFPADFSSDFLNGREGYFYGAYQWAFYPHIASGPVSLLLGLLLVSDTFRARLPLWHRRFGRIHAVGILFVVAPSGLWMAYYTTVGTSAAISFAILAVLTGMCSALGWRAAVSRRFNDHRLWMLRCFVLLCSAVMLRVFGGLGTVLEVKSLWFDPVVSWVSWLLPLVTFELLNARKSGSRRGAAASATPP